MAIFQKFRGRTDVMCEAHGGVYRFNRRWWRGERRRADYNLFERFGIMLAQICSRGLHSSLKGIALTSSQQQACESKGRFGIIPAASIAVKVNGSAKVITQVSVIALRCTPGDSELLFECVGIGISAVTDGGVQPVNSFDE